MKTGIVKFFIQGKYGFVTPDDGERDIYLHWTCLQRSGVDTVVAGDRVRFAMGEFRGRPQIERIELVDGDDSDDSAGDTMPREVERVAVRYGE